MTVTVFDDTPCKLGEGPLWHPERGQLYWFDITGNALHTRVNDTAKSWQFDEHVSAAGWIDRDTILIASETALQTFDLETGRSEFVCALESDNPVTRSNDGRADPYGGFWIGTMGLHAEIGAGAIYRYYKGELRRLFASVTIPNSICFSPDRRFAYFADTVEKKIWRQALDEENGWPKGDTDVFIDFAGTGINPDGSVCDAEGYLWNAQWGAGRVVRYSPAGEMVSEIALPTNHITCPAFGGEDMRALFATSASDGLTEEQRANQPDAGKTFVTTVEVSGMPEPQVTL